MYSVSRCDAEPKEIPALTHKSHVLHFFKVTERDFNKQNFHKDFKD